MRSLVTRTLFRTALTAFALLAFGAPTYAADVSTSIYISICGDGIVQFDEVCDAGSSNNTGAYASSSVAKICTASCQSYGPYCGDGILQARFDEGCDDSNNTSGDLCSATCQPETAVLPSSGGTPAGSIPGSNSPQGTIPSSLVTQVVLRGKAYPNASIDILLDGARLASTRADSNADFLYTSTAVTPGTATFSFLAHDSKGVESLTSSATFNVVQSAVTTASNIFIPPSISASATQLAPGDLLTLSGQSVPGASVVTQLSDSASNALPAQADADGNWALQVTTGSLAKGYYNAKSYFQISTTIKSGYGKAINFYIGNGDLACDNSTDLNNDKKVNLVDFSIFLTHWGTNDTQGDFNCNGIVNLADFSILLFNWTG